MKCDKQRYLHTISIQEKETIIMVAVSCQGDRRSTAKTNQKKIRYPLRKWCNRAALTYINATRPQGSWGIGWTTTSYNKCARALVTQSSWSPLNPMCHTIRESSWWRRAHAQHMPSMLQLHCLLTCMCQVKTLHPEGPLATLPVISPVATLKYLCLFSTSWHVP